MGTYYTFKSTRIGKKYPSIAESDYLDSQDNCVVTNNTVYYYTESLSLLSVILGYFKQTFTLRPWNLFLLSSYKSYKFHTIDIDKIDLISESSVRNFVKKTLAKIENDKKREAESIASSERLRELKRLKEIEDREILNKFKEELQSLDVDRNGLIDVIEVNGFSELLGKYQNEILEINREYIKHFVQVANFLKTKRSSIQAVYTLVMKTIDSGESFRSINLRTLIAEQDPNEKLQTARLVSQFAGIPISDAKLVIDDFYKHRNNDVLDKLVEVRQDLDTRRISAYVELLKDDVYLMKALLFYSVVMIKSLIKEDMITFYEVYEKFDKLNMFDSKFERDMLSKLDTMNHSLDDIMKQIQTVGEGLISAVGDLSLATEKSAELISEGLAEVNSSIGVGNLLSGLQNYQLLRMNRKVSRLI